jgi:hypothetical protein
MMANSIFEQYGGRKRKEGEPGCKQCIYSQMCLMPGLDPQKDFGCKVVSKGEYFIFCTDEDTCDYFEPIPSVK